MTFYNVLFELEPKLVEVEFIRVCLPETVFKISPKPVKGMFNTQNGRNHSQNSFQLDMW